jgi:hypothetical protein
MYGATDEVSVMTLRRQCKRSRKAPPSSTHIMNAAVLLQPSGVSHLSCRYLGVPHITGADAGVCPPTSCLFSKPLALPTNRGSCTQQANTATACSSDVKQHVSTPTCHHPLGSMPGHDGHAEPLHDLLGGSNAWHPLTCVHPALNLVLQDPPSSSSTRINSTCKQHKSTKRGLGMLLSCMLLPFFLPRWAAVPLSIIANPWVLLSMYFRQSGGGTWHGVVHAGSSEPH